MSCDISLSKTKITVLFNIPVYTIVYIDMYILYLINAKQNKESIQISVIYPIAGNIKSS